MKRRITSASAAAIALSLIGAVAAAPVSSSKPDAAKPTPKPSPSKSAGPKISKWQQHVQEEMKISAPGDEYFGRMKMSYLGINNTFHDNLIRAGAYTTDPGMIGRINFAEEALVAWYKKYPNDPQLARSYFLAFQMYRKIWVQTYQDKAWIYANRVIQKWPSSYFGKALKKDLSIGFTEHYFATPVACPEVTPSASPSPGGRNQATPVPSPTASPTPVPTPTQIPGGPKVEVLPVPCLTPTPAPTPLPSFTPLPSGTLAPAASPSSSASPSAGAPSSTPSPTPSPLPSASPTV